MIREIHNQYLEAGADIIETNTFNGTSIAMAIQLEHMVRALNRGRQACARECCAEWLKKTPDKLRFVASALGPTDAAEHDFTRRQRRVKAKRGL